MLRLNMPRLAFQRQSQLGDDCWHSVVISLLRGCAAIMVAAAHLRAEVFPGLRSVADASLWYKGFAFATGFSHHAVLVFFVISGWLVGGSLLNKIGQRDAIANFAIDRMSRLWTVLIPTFVLSLLFGLGSGVLNAHSVDFSTSAYSARSFAGNLIGLQTVTLPNFGENFALWSLANETWYYTMFPLLVLLFTARSNLTRVACGATLVVLATALPAAMIAYFAIWLLGVAFSRIRIECGNGARIGWLALLAAVSVYYRLTGNLDNFDLTTLRQDLVCSAMLLVFLSSLQFKGGAASKLLRPATSVGKFFADFSFSLYVLHLPLIALLTHWGMARFGLRQLSPDEPLHYAIYAAMLAILLGGSYLSYLLFESHTYRIRRLLKDLLLRRTSPQPNVRTMPADR